MATDTLTKPESRYEDDRYAWLLEQIDLFAARRFRELDSDNLVQELEDLAHAMYGSVHSRARTIALHLLKLQHSPATDPRRGWRHTVRVQRADLQLELTKQLNDMLQRDLEKIYQAARGVAEGDLRDYGEHAAADALPATCPYTLEQIMGDWWPEEG